MARETSSKVSGAGSSPSSGGSGASSPATGAASAAAGTSPSANTPKLPKLILSMRDKTVKALVSGGDRKQQQQQQSPSGGAAAATVASPSASGRSGNPVRSKSFKDNNGDNKPSASDLKEEPMETDDVSSAPVAAANNGGSRPSSASSTAEEMKIGTIKSLSDFVAYFLTTNSYPLLEMPEKPSPSEVRPSLSCSPPSSVVTAGSAGASSSNNHGSQCDDSGAESGKYHE